MIIIPSIDLLGGACVRLYQGSYERATVYDGEPVEIARGFERAGALRIHLVDLDAARGTGTNRELIRAIRSAVACQLEVGGGVRTEGDVEELEAAGVDRIVVGTTFAHDPELVGAWALRHRLLVAGIDARDGRVRVSGWERDSGIAEGELAARAGELGFLAIVYTEISRDGTLGGPDLERTAGIARTSGLPVVLSGGVRKDADFAAAARTAGIAGVITGRALYEGAIDLADSIRRHQTGTKDELTW